VLFNNLSFVIGLTTISFGNDVLIDDILVRQIPKSCNTVASFLLLMVAKLSQVLQVLKM
jgi:hypothetical protein